MGETDYRDETWTERDWEELHKAGLECLRKRELMKTPEGRQQLAWEREEANRKYREGQEWLERVRPEWLQPSRHERLVQNVLENHPTWSREEAEEMLKWWEAW